MKKRKKIRVVYAIPNFILILFSVTCIFPAIWLIYSSMKEKTEFYHSPIALPAHPSIQHYISILTESEFLSWLFNSFRTSVIALVFYSDFRIYHRIFSIQIPFPGKKRPVCLLPGRNACPGTCADGSDVRAVYQDRT